MKYYGLLHFGWRDETNLCHGHCAGEQVPLQVSHCHEMIMDLKP